MSGGGSRNPTPPIGRPASTPTPPQVSRVSMLWALATSSPTSSLSSVATVCIPLFCSCLRMLRQTASLFTSCFKVLLVTFLWVGSPFRAATRASELLHEIHRSFVGNLPPTPTKWVVMRSPWSLGSRCCEGRCRQWGCKQVRCFRRLPSLDSVDGAWLFSPVRTYLPVLLVWRVSALRISKSALWALSGLTGKVCGCSLQRNQRGPRRAKL